MNETILRCPICHGIGRIRTSLPGGHPTFAPCPACPPSETVNEALEHAGHENQGTAYDPGAAGYELQGRRTKP